MILCPWQKWIEEKKDIIEGVANTIRLTNPKTGIRMSEIGGHPIIQALKTKHAAPRRASRACQYPAW